MDYETEVGIWLERPYVKLAIIIVFVLMVVFLALKSGFSLWLMTKLNLGSEHLTGPPGSAARAIGAYDRSVLTADLYQH